MVLDVQVSFTARSILFFQSCKDPLSRILMRTSMSDFKDQSLDETLKRFLSVPLQLLRGCRYLVFELVPVLVAVSTFILISFTLSSLQFSGFNFSAKSETMLKKHGQNEPTYSQKIH